MRILTIAVCAAMATPFGAALAQPAERPPIEAIDLYGLRTIPEDRLRALLPFKEGDAVPDGPPPTEAIAAELGVARVAMTMVCCGEAGGALIYVGVAEGEDGASPYFEAPSGDVRLADDVAAAYRAFSQAMEAAVRAGDGGEDVSQGHSLVNNPAARAIQEQFLVFAERDRDQLVEVLMGSADANHRAAAATVLGYVGDKPAIVDELVQAAAFDPDEGVRNNATRALGVMAMYASQTPDTGIVIDAAPFLYLLDSTVWSDRNKGLFLLGTLTQTRDPAVLAELRARSLPALTEMCRWKNWGHAQSACMVLQRVLGLPDDAAPSSREATLAAAETAAASP